MRQHQICTQGVVDFMKMPDVAAAAAFFAADTTNVLAADVSAETREISCLRPRLLPAVVVQQNRLLPMASGRGRTTPDSGQVHTADGPASVCLGQSRKVHYDLFGSLRVFEFQFLDISSPMALPSSPGFLYG